MENFYLPNGAGIMTDEHRQLQKIRFKFANGEEFEAEGTLDFVEKQRDYFLTLIKKRPQLSAREDTSVSGPLTPRLYATAPGAYATAAPTQGSPSSPKQQNSFTADLHHGNLWLQLLKQEGDILFLRRKLRLSPQESSLLILGGAKDLLDRPACSALFLAKALERSGLHITRLDRQLAPAIKLGYIRCEGAKRSRTYALTPAGFAHAFMLAQKKAADLPLS